MIRLALLEMRRAPRRFVPTVAVLATVMFLALAVSALADGLLRASTGSLRNTDADLYVFADGAQRNVLRSMLPDVLQLPVGFTTGVEDVGTIGFSPAAVLLPDVDEEQAVMAVSVSHAFAGRPNDVIAGRLPFDGEPRVAAIEERLAAEGVGLGDRIGVVDAFEVEVIGIVRDASYLLRPTIWLPPSEFATVRNAALPEFDIDESLTSVLAVRSAAGADPAEVAAAIDETFAEALEEREELADIEGGIETVTSREAYRAIPGVASQQSTLRAMVVVVLVVAAAVIAVFLALLTLERRPLLASLMAAGVPSRAIIGVLAVQAVAAAVCGAIVGSLATAVLLAVAPASIPLHLTVTSLASVTGGAVAAAGFGAIGFAATLRRLDPAAELLTGR